MSNDTYYESLSAEAAKSPSPRVSVLVPVRNCEGFLKEAIESIAKQTLGDLEIIVIDDGSTDTTPQLLSKLADEDSRIHVMTQSQMGITQALEAGRSQAQGRYIARMDADDVALPNRLAEQVAFLDRHPTVVAVGGQVRVINEKGRFLKRGRYPVSPTECRVHLGYGAPLCHPAVMMRRYALESVGGYRRGFEPAEDYDLWLRLSKIGDLANLEKDVLQYRVHPDATTQRRADQNARAASMALLAHQRNDEILPVIREALQASDVPWLEVEAALPPDIRLTTRAAYLRALILNGGINNTIAFSLLVHSVPDFIRAGECVYPKEQLGFMLLRAVYQTARNGEYQRALASLLLGTRYLPLAFWREAAMSLAARFGRIQNGRKGN